MRTPGDHRKIFQSHVDDMKIIWLCAGSKPFYSSDIVPGLHGKMLMKYGNNGYLTSTRPMTGHAAKRRVWQIADSYLKDCREKFGPEPEGKNREEKVCITA